MTIFLPLSDLFSQPSAFPVSTPTLATVLHLPARRVGEGVNMKTLQMIKMRFFLFLLLVPLIYGQLIGSRGVIKLKEGVEYRDIETVDASKAIAEFAKIYQPLLDKVASRRKTKLKKILQSVVFVTKSLNKFVRKMKSSDIFDFQSSRLIEPLEELRFNKPLEEIENERTTPPTRLLPDNHFVRAPKHANTLGKVSKLAKNPTEQRKIATKAEPTKAQPLEQPRINKTSLATIQYSVCSNQSTFLNSSLCQRL